MTLTEFRMRLETAIATQRSQPTTESDRKAFLSEALMWAAYLDNEHDRDVATDLLADSYKRLRLIG